MANVYTFLSQLDFENQIQASHLNQATQNNASIIRHAEAAAVSFCKDYLSQRFDCSHIFPTFINWSAQVTYKPLADETRSPYLFESGQLKNYVWHLDKFWKCLVQNTNSTPLEGNVNWQAYDPRDPKLVRIVTDVALFHIIRRVSPDKLQGIRLEMYNEAKEWLDMAREGRLTPNLPTYIDVTQPSVDTPLWGSNPVRTHTW